ncbi:RGG repeats nuclear RNA binding protein B [Cardamine amara subsp. amara]|uniref:RGG repeats nuclear RNA binding protein B n=1 Tax=Cardamine amara subsp. amara TaxID=228776 RepID=A0ABD1BUT1_CARAN
MASLNPFDLLDNDAEDLSQLVAAKSLKAVKPAPVQPAGKGARNTPANGGRGGRGGGSGRGRGGGYNKDYRNNGAAPANGNGYGGGYNRRSEEGDGARRSGPVGGYRSGRRGGYSNGESGDYERPRRNYERLSGTGHGNEFKRDGAGRGNWGTTEDDISPVTEESTAVAEKNLAVEKESGEGEATDVKKETSAEEQVEREPEVKTMTLGEYEKVLEEKKKALQATKVEERKVDTKAFEAMQQLSSKKSNNNDVFIKLGTEKDKRITEREGKGKKSLDIMDIKFLKPARYVRKRPEPREPREGSVGGAEHQKVGGAEHQKVGGAEHQKVGGAEHQKVGGAEHRKVRGAEHQRVGGGRHQREGGGGHQREGGGGHQREGGGGHQRNGRAATPAIEDPTQFPTLGK